MTVKERITAIRLSEKILHQPEYSERFLEYQFRRAGEEEKTVESQIEIIREVE